MDIISVLTKAINERKTISYEYNKPGKTPGERIGNPYAIYNASTGNINAHIVQTSGVSDSTDKQPLPSFRTHLIDQLSNVQILEDKPPFSPDFSGYNSDSDMYNDAIAKV